MRKKVLMLTLMLLAMLTLSIINVQAAPKEKLDFELYIVGRAIDWGEDAHAGPRGTEAADVTKPDLIQRTLHIKATVFEIYSAILTIDEGSFEMTEGDFDISEDQSFNFNWATMAGTSKAKDTITFSDGEEVWGTLEISVREKMNFATMPPSSEGIIFGKGTGALKGVKIEGTTTGIHIPQGDPSGDPLPIDTMLTRVGTISGWTSPPSSP
jgi:hypothetical protein